MSKSKILTLALLVAAFTAYVGVPSAEAHKCRIKTCIPEHTHPR